MNDNEKWHRHLGGYGICINEGNLLVIRKGKGPYNGRYDLPGGTIAAHESLAEAVQREFIEEAGIHIHVKKNIGVCDYLIPYELPKRNTTHIHHVAIFYLVQYDAGKLTDNPDKFEGQDSLGAFWVPMNDCTIYNSSPLVLQAIAWLNTGQLPFDVQRLDI